LVSDLVMYFVDKEVVSVLMSLVLFILYNREKRNEKNPAVL
jgi:hypothetical protein